MEEKNNLEADRKQESLEIIALSLAGKYIDNYLDRKYEKIIDDVEKYIKENYDASRILKEARVYIEENVFGSPEKRKEIRQKEKETLENLIVEKTLKIFPEINLNQYEASYPKINEKN